MTHLLGVLLSLAADIKMTHVPYRGTDAGDHRLPGRTDSARHSPTTAGVTGARGSRKARSARHRFGAERDEQFPEHADADRSGLSARVVVGWAVCSRRRASPPQASSHNLHGGMVKCVPSPDVMDAILRQGSKAVSSSSPA
jgi:hypothetical protein